jgi:DNA polymerase-3 subunit delta
MSVQLVTGDDAVLLAEAVVRIVKDTLGDEDRSLALEQLDEASLRDPDGGWSLAPLVDAAQTEPFLTQRRVVVGRHLARFSRSGQYDDLVRLLEGLPATTDLVLVWERGVDPTMGGRLPPIPKALTAAVKAAGGAQLDVNPPTRKSDAGKWLRDQLKQSSLRFEPAATAAVEDLLGADRGNVVGLLRTLEGALGAGGTVTADDVAVYGGDAGSVVPWELDDAIDRGDIAAALKVLHRLLPSRHPLQLLAALHGRYQRMLRLDGAGVADERQAAALLGMRGSTFPAKKILGQTRRLGSEKVARAIRLLADADLALRGTVDWPDELVLEVLVARLAQLSSR